MFEVKVFVEDKKLHSTLWALDGLVVGTPEITPVRDAKARGGKVISTRLSTGESQPARVAAYILSTNAKEVSATHIYEAMKALGIGKMNYGYIIKRLEKAKFITRKHPNGLRTVLK